MIGSAAEKEEALQRSARGVTVIILKKLCLCINQVVETSTYLEI
jgi:hypothetical protein